LRRGCQCDGLYDHLLDFRLARCQRLSRWKANLVRGHTSKASMSSEAACFEGADRLHCADIRFMRSQTCWRVGALVTDARWSGNRAPGGSILPCSICRRPSHDIITYHCAGEPTRPLVLGKSRPENLAGVGVRLMQHLHTP